MNQVIILGRMARDPEVKYLDSGKVCCRITLAVDNGYGENKQTSFVPCTCWGKTAEVVGNNVKKGERLLVNGSLQIRSYEDKQGQKRTATDINVFSVDFIEKREKSAENSENGGGFAAFGAELDF